MRVTILTLSPMTFLASQIPASENRTPLQDQSVHSVIADMEEDREQGVPRACFVGRESSSATETSHGVQHAQGWGTIVHTMMRGHWQDPSEVTC